MSLINELETISDNMSPRFMADIKNKLKEVVEDPSKAKIAELKSEINEFVWAVKIMGGEQLEGRLADLTDVLEGSGSFKERLDRFTEEFNRLEEIIPAVEPDEDVEEAEPEGEPEEPVEIDEAKVERLLMIPGIGRVKALALINAGFESVEDLANAPLARITMVPGISLSLSKDIADFLNPNRFSDVEVLPKTLDRPRLTEEIPFAGTKAAEPDAGEAVEIYEDDPELMELFITRLKLFIGEVTMMLEECETSTPSGKVMSSIEETSLSLLNVTRYMGLDLIESELSNIAEVTGDIISGDIELSESTIFAIKQAKTGLEYGLDKLSEFKKIPDLPQITDEEILPEEDEAAHKDMDEIQRLYRDMGGILKKVSKGRKLEEEDVKKLKGSTELLNKMAESLTKSSD